MSGLHIHKASLPETIDRVQLETKENYLLGCFFLFGFIVFSATFNNISAILWRSHLLVEETGGPGENPRHVASH